MKNYVIHSNIIEDKKTRIMEDITHMQMRSKGSGFGKERVVATTEHSNE